jgi:hypothetical protein
MAGCERSFRVGSPEPAEHEQILDAHARQRRRSPNDILHQQRQVLGVIDHRHTSAGGNEPQARVLATINGEL